MGVFIYIVYIYILRKKSPAQRLKNIWYALEKKGSRYLEIRTKTYMYGKLKKIWRYRTSILPRFFALFRSICKVTLTKKSQSSRISISSQFPLHTRTAHAPKIHKNSAHPLSNLLFFIYPLHYTSVTSSCVYEFVLYVLFYAAAISIHSRHLLPMLYPSCNSIPTNQTLYRRQFNYAVIAPKDHVLA